MEERGHYSTIILDSIAEGVFTVDMDWNITSFNREAERITNVKKNEAIGAKCFDVFKTPICKSDCALRKTITSGKVIINQRINIINKNGENFPISVSTALLKDKNEQIIGGVETFRDCSEIELLKGNIEKLYTFHDIVGKSPKIQEIMSILPDIAQSSSTVLIQGPSGSGKEIFARALHNLSKRHKGPFVAINCGAIPETLLESELFGHVKGAFTDAQSNKPGKFKCAEGGTLFFDEIGDLSSLLQVKLLRVIQEKEYEPVGSVKSYKTNVRLVLASNKDLAALVREGKFRDDLYYRINVIKLTLPPLTERREDIHLLISYFITVQNCLTGKNIKNVSDEVMEFFMNYDFPGNIRELQNIIEYAFILCHGDVVELHHLPRELTTPTQLYEPPEKNITTFAHAEAQIIKKALEKNRWSRKNTAQELGMNLSTLWRKMKKHHLL
ncbi:MAG: sigma-54 interaction domain-containing protein [bacterium]